MAPAALTNGAHEHVQFVTACSALKKKPIVRGLDQALP